ncbi:fungal-specific transcription factor domain-containing protein [Podospora didyma]|uniref:Fungal-specific transcription factor domain-containing protein n=1 Tax=Podospora didyma TaxID=330526 RepID=A0AAE0NDB0_9PEZI|nr:fungal-specific transcription factor domain-containing protein [Podospora didyma]
MADPLPQQPHQPTKRTRVLLSCAPCRASKLKCDRHQPCGQCVKKVRADGCTYAPRPEKLRPARSMAARLKRLEGMVRGMMDVDGVPITSAAAADKTGPIYDSGPAFPVSGPGSSTTAVICAAAPGTFPNQAQVVVGRSTTYVGATHFMAMLDDIEDLKSYFDEEDDESQGEPGHDMPESQSPDMLLIFGSRPTTKQELLELLPSRAVVDRLVQRYFTAHSPSLSVIHRPEFAKLYSEFWADPESAELHWLALLFLILSLGVFFSTFMAPHELEADADAAPMERFRRYRGAAASALVTGRYTSAHVTVLQPFLLFVEAEFLTNRASQMNCYLLTSVCIRLMLRMGLHRDPSKLAHITPFDGEIRRRMWHLAIQLELMVSFHMGLPSMVHSIESDTALPRNLIDDDLDVNCTELPPSRPDSEYTWQTYPRWKATICAVFGQIARQANSLTIPAYHDVMKLDNLLESKWAQIPSIMKLKPLEDTIADPPSIVNQRFGLSSLYQKARCVLHRRYIIEAAPKPEHAYSRRVCLESAMKLLEGQSTIHVAALPGGLMRMNGWFVMSLAIHDFLLAAMVVYLVLQNDTYDVIAAEWDDGGAVRLPDKDHLYGLLTRSHRIWIAVYQCAPVFKKAADILDTMVKKLGSLGFGSGQHSGSSDAGNNHGRREEAPASSWRQSFSQQRVMESISVGGLSIDDDHHHPWYPEPPGVSPEPQMEPLTRSDLGPHHHYHHHHTGVSVNTLDPSQWLGTGINEMDWSTFDSAIQSENTIPPGSTLADGGGGGGWNLQGGGSSMVDNFHYVSGSQGTWK